MNLNLLSMNKKKEFSTIIDKHNPHIIVGTETWLHPGISSKEVRPHGYVIRKDRKDTHGSVLIVVRKYIKYHKEWR